MIALSLRCEIIILLLLKLLKGGMDKYVLKRVSYGLIGSGLQKVQYGLPMFLLQPNKYIKTQKKGGIKE